MGGKTRKSTFKPIKFKSEEVIFKIVKGKKI